MLIRMRFCFLTLLALGALALPTLAEAAMSVAQAFRFSPAMSRENRVPVRIAPPITFTPAGVR